MMHRDAEGNAINQPILARCGICNQWCIYAVKDSGRRDGRGAGRPGLLLNVAASKGAPWVMIPGDGRYYRNWLRAEVWGQRAHLCPRNVLLAFADGEREAWKAAAT